MLDSMISGPTPGSFSGVQNCLNPQNSYKKHCLSHANHQKLLCQPSCSRTQCKEHLLLFIQHAPNTLQTISTPTHTHTFIVHSSIFSCRALTSKGSCVLYKTCTIYCQRLEEPQEENRGNNHTRNHAWACLCMHVCECVLNDIKNKENKKKNNIVTTHCYKWQKI